MVVCDGLSGLPDALNTVWTDMIVQTCIVHYADAGITSISCGTRSSTPPARAGTRSPAG
jgi:hypothetical protein